MPKYCRSGCSCCIFSLGLQGESVRASSGETDLLLSAFKPDFQTFIFQLACGISSLHIQGFNWD